MAYQPCGDGVFQTAFKDVLVYEGGLCDDPNDAGGLTNYGLCHFDNLTDEQIRNLTVEQAGDIYKRKYWDVCRCAVMPEKTARCVFDFAVNAGISRGVSLLQQLLGSAADGIFGPRSLNDLKFFLSKHPEESLLHMYFYRRNALYRAWASVPGQEVFLQGWLARSSDLANKLGVPI